MADDSIFKLLSAARNATGAAQARVTELDAEISALEAQAVSLNGAPLTKEDFLATMAKATRARGDRYRDQMARQPAMPYGMALQAGSDTYLGRIVVPGYGMGPLVTEDALCLFAEDGINAGWKRIADTMGWPEAAPSMEYRGKMLADLAAQLASLRQQRAALVGAMGGAFKEPAIRVELSENEAAMAAAEAEPLDASARRHEARRQADDAARLGRSGI